MKDDKELYDLIPADVNEILEWVETTSPAIGRAPRPAKPSDMAPAINKMPTCAVERYAAVLAKRKAGYQLTVSESLEFATFGGDDTGYAMNDDGEYGYPEGLHNPMQASGFSDQW